MPKDIIKAIGGIFLTLVIIFVILVILDVLERQAMIQHVQSFVDTVNYVDETKRTEDFTLSLKSTVESVIITPKTSNEGSMCALKTGKETEYYLYLLFRNVGEPNCFTLPNSISITTTYTQIDCSQFNGLPAACGTNGCEYCPDNTCRSFCSTLPTESSKEFPGCTEYELEIGRNDEVVINIKNEKDICGVIENIKRAIW